VNGLSRTCGNHFYLFLSFILDVDYRPYILELYNYIFEGTKSKRIFTQGMLTKSLNATGLECSAINMQQQVPPKH
jgi:hypothetical protein